MNTLEPPTVLTRPPPTDSPDLPAPPAPSRDPYASPPVRNLSPPLVNGRGADTVPCKQTNSGKGDRQLEDKQRGAGMGGSQWRELLKEWNLLLTLENSGSVARDHLASERTFLAYTRTSLTVASTGVALVQLFTLSAAATDKSLERYARPLGAVIIALGLVIMLVGVARYFLIQNALIRGVYPVARVSTSFLSFVLLALVLVVFVLIMVAR